MDKTLDLKKIIIKTLDLNKALDIVSIDLKDKSSMADYMIIASGTSSRHIQALSEQVLEKLKESGVNESKIEGKTSLADYMIIASGTSSRHIQSLSEKVLNELKLSGIQESRIEGEKSSDWKLVDGIDLIVHIFNPEKRKFYELEKMWSELIPKEKLII